MSASVNPLLSVTLERDALLAALAAVVRVVERRTTIPILSNVRINVGGGRMTLTATDLDVEAQVSLPLAALDAAEVSTTVPATTLHDIVRKMNAGAQMSVEWNREDVAIRSGRSRFTIRTLPSSDFPSLDAGELTHSFSLAGKDVAEAFDEVSFAISTEETRYYLNGIFLHTIDGPEGPMLRFVATDGHRLSRRERLAPQGSDGMPAIIVPRKTVAEIKRLAETHKGDLAFAVSKAKIRVTAGDIVFTSKLIDGSFPDYQRVIPSSNEKLAVLDRSELASAVERVSTISSERGRAVKLSFGDNKLTLTVQNPDAGNAVEEVDCEYDDAPIDIGFNGRYLADALSALGGDTVQMRLDAPGAPALMQRRADSPLLVVLMPMRV